MGESGLTEGERGWVRGRCVSAACSALDRSPLVMHLATIDVTIQHLLLPQLLQLKEAGYRVTAASSPGPGGVAAEAAGIPFIPVPMDRSLISWTHPRALWRLIRILRKRRVHVLHVHTPVAAVLGRVAALLARTPLVFYTAHGFYFHEHMPRLYRFPIQTIEWTLGKITDHLFTQSAEDYATALRMGIATAERATVLGNGVDVAVFAGSAEKRATIRAELGLGAQQVIAFTGRFVREKGITELLQAMAILRSEHPDVRLLIIGGSLPSDRDPAEQHVGGLVRDLRLDEMIIATGFTDRVADYLSAADIFVLPSYREGMPRSILEAMAAGKPVVATNIRGCREEVVEGTTGYLVPVRDAGTLAEKLRILLDDPELRSGMGAAGQARARGLFDERLVHERLLTVYGRYLTHQDGAAESACP